MKNVKTSMSKQSSGELLDDDDFLQYLKTALPEANDLARTASSIELTDLGGNLNRVRRIAFSPANGLTRTYIVKHVPLGGKLSSYPSIEFSDDRLEREHHWYHHMRHHLHSQGSKHLAPLKTPEILLFDRDMRVLIMEDLGVGRHFESLLDDRECKALVLKSLGTCLGKAHKASLQLEEKPKENIAARQNRHYVFAMHLDEPETVRHLWRERADKNGEGEFSCSDRISIQKDYIDMYGQQLRPVLNKMKESFKNNGRAVYTHGDLHTRSIIVDDKNRIGIIDAELSDFGNACFDLGIFSAHLWAHSISLGLPQSAVIEDILLFVRPYLKTFENHGANSLSDREFVGDFVRHTGAEMLRRLIGPAGFNIDLERTTFNDLLITATDMLLDCDYLISQLMAKSSHE